MKSFPKVVRVNRFVYDVFTRNEYGEKEVCLHPRTGGSTARSGLSYNLYEYTHGGKTFQAAVEKAKELAEKLETAPARSILEAS